MNNSKKDHGSKSKKRNGTNYNINTNPRRGPGGILITCETGRERKCQHETLEVLRHYWKQQQNKTLPSANASKQNNDPNAYKNDLKSDKSKALMSLDDELDALKQENKKRKRGDNSGLGRFPFAVYDTGCRGTIFVLFTGIVTEKSNYQEIDVAHDVSICKVNENLTETKKGSAIATLEKKSITESQTSITQLISIETDRNKNGLHNIESSCSKFDPLRTVESIVQDLRSYTVGGTSKVSTRINPLVVSKSDDHGSIKNDNSHSKFSKCSPCIASSYDEKQTTSTVIPNSRYVIRMIPIQATCFASVEELQRTVDVLLKSLLLTINASKECNSKSVKAETNVNVDASTRSESEAVHDTSSSGITSTNDVYDDVDDTILKTAVAPKNMISYSIQSKRRICNHLNRDQIITAVVERVTLLAPTWKVNLRQPTYSIHIEICRTLCGISIFGSDYLKHSVPEKFNLSDLREKLIGGDGS